jgi:branched-chain amino acid transport system substrate-binding protein
MQQIYRANLIIILVMSPFLFALGITPRDGSSHSNRPLRVGVLASLTASGSSLGQNTVAAIQVAVEQLEAEPSSQGAKFKVHLFVRDTKLDPNLALQAIQELDKQGVKVIIGPQTSSELAMIKPFADEHNILVISQGSTASSLAIAGDNIFRVCPNDKREAAAITALMWRDGIRTIVPLWRNDVGNNGLHDSVQNAFQELGGAVTSGFRYEPSTTDFDSAIAAISSQVANARLNSNASTVGVYLAGFDEVVGVFRSAQSDPTLSSTAWYGSDGVALSQALLDDSTAAAFAASIGYPNPIFGLDDSLQSAWQPVSDAIQARTGIKPDAFAISAYDAMFVIDRALQHSRRIGEFAAFKSAFVDAANNFTGVTGSTALDAAGDRLLADFDFWAVRSENGAFTWVRVGRYKDGMLF